MQNKKSTHQEGTLNLIAVKRLFCNAFTFPEKGGKQYANLSNYIISDDCR